MPEYKLLDQQKFPTVSGVTLIGCGTDVLPIEDGDLAIASKPDANGRFASIRMSRDGTIRFNERVVTSDAELVDNFRILIRYMMRAYY